MEVTMIVVRKDNPASVHIRDNGTTLYSVAHIDAEINALLAARAWLKRQLDKKTEKKSDK